MQVQKLLNLRQNHSFTEISLKHKLLLTVETRTPSTDGKKVLPRLMITAWSFLGDCKPVKEVINRPNFKRKRKEIVWAD